MIRQLAIAGGAYALLTAALLMGGCVGNDQETVVQNSEQPSVPEATGATEHAGATEVAAGSIETAGSEAAMAGDALATDGQTPLAAGASMTYSTADNTTHAEVVFDSAAFPPTLPRDDAHLNAWLRKDCILCHQSGVAGAPIVQHVGMSKALLDARCRTCHIVSGVPSVDEVVFARRAFPPTMPVDGLHQGAWLRDDCLMCHQTGAAGAPKVVHQGMSGLLLEARCRSCHLPSASSIDVE